MFSLTLLAIVAGILLFLLRIIFVRRWLSSYDPSLREPLPPTLTIDGVEQYLREREQREEPLKPAAASSVQWAKRQGERTDLVVVFVHGFSAGTREIDPVDREIASQLDANLLRIRLSGHGIVDLDRAGAAMDATGCKDLIRDVAIAFALGKLLGKRVVLLGCSTGGSLAVWLAAQPWVGDELATLILFAPAFAIAKLGTNVYNCLKWIVLLLPSAGSSALLRMLAGETNKVPLVTEEQKTIWTMEYPSSAIRHVVATYVALEVSVSYTALRLPVLAFANPADRVVDFNFTKRNIGLMPRGSLEVITNS